jgi:hypothetical protein
MSEGKTSETPAAPEPVGVDASVKVALFAVVAFGLVAAAGAFFFSGVRMAFSVAVGASVAASNLYLIARIVKNATTGNGPGIWGVLGAVKVLVLLLGVWMLMKISVVDPIGLVIGFGCLPVGIFVSGALKPKER